MLAILSSKSGFPLKKPVSSAYNSASLTSTFPWAGHPYLACSSNALCVLPISSHKILRWTILKNWDLIELVVFTTS